MDAGDPLAAARARIARLTVTAARVVAPGAGPLLDGTSGSPAARLARDLARNSPPPSDAGTQAAAAADYLLALQEAATAVYYCRRVQHATGGCWFDSGEICGRVLAAAHALGQRADHTGAPR